MACESVHCFVSLPKGFNVCFIFIFNLFKSSSAYSIQVIFPLAFYSLLSARSFVVAFYFINTLIPLRMRSLKYKDKMNKKDII